MNTTDKKRFRKKYIYRGLCMIILMLIATAGFFAVWYNFVVKNNQTGHLTGIANLLMSIGIYSILFLLLGRCLGGFRIGVDRKMNLIIAQALSVSILNFVEIFLSMAITGQFRFFGMFLWRYLVLSIVQSLVLGLAVTFMINLYRKKFPPLQILEIYGEYESCLFDKVNGRSDKYHITTRLSYKSGVTEIVNQLVKADAVLINDVNSDLKNEIVKRCYGLNKRVYFTPKISDIISKSSESLNLFDTPLFLCKNNGISDFELFWKRFFDILLSGLALIFFSPIMLITAIAIKLDDNGPVFFKQERVTIGGKRFMIMKFRSMIVDAEKDGRPHPAGEKDNRITKVGRVIRTTRIDELPQLINILCGDMSIVGPRPERWEHDERYSKEIPEFGFRLKMKGGLTGYAQVYGKYNTSALDKLKLDLFYITNYSLILDIQIIFETIKILFEKEKTEGFTKEKQAEMKDY